MRNQKSALLAAVAFLVVAVLYQFVYLPGKKQLRSLRDAAGRKTADLAKLEDMCRQYAQMKGQRSPQTVATVPDNFSLLQFIGDCIDATRLRDNIREVKPLPESRIAGMLQERVSCVAENISLEKVCELMQALQDSGQPVYIPTFRLKKNRDKPFLMTVEFETAVLKGQPAPAR